MKIARWLLVVVLAFLMTAGCLDCMRMFIEDSFTILSVLVIALDAVSIIALLKMQKKWLVAAVICNLVRFGFMELTAEYVQTHSIYITLTIATLLYLALALKSHQKVAAVS